MLWLKVVFFCFSLNTLAETRPERLLFDTLFEIIGRTCFSNLHKYFCL